MLIQPDREFLLCLLRCNCNNRGDDLLLKEMAMSRSAIRAATSMVLAICVGGHAEAQTWPSRTVTLVVPSPAGGPTDTIGRVIAEGLHEALGQPVIIENVPCATGSIGTGRVARAEADGYTLILGTGATHVFNAAAYPLKYD